MGAVALLIMQQSHSHLSEDSGAQVSAIVKALHCPVPTASPTSLPTPLSL